MGRRNVRVEDSDRWVFNRLAPFYRLRPAYPPAVVDYLVGLTVPEASVVDLGAGTGSLSVPLAERGLRVSAVEPSQAMLSELCTEAAARNLPIQAVHAAAECTGLGAGAFELALIADALHWLDAERAGAEVARLLAPGGSCAVVEVRLRETPFVQALQSRIRKANPKAAASAGTRQEQLLALAVPRSRCRACEHFSVTDRLDAEQLRGTLCSLSYVGPAIGPAALESLLAEVRELADDDGGAEWPREITVTSVAG
ncbi:MAG: class I SAM-dependent methyltransferase [Deltaproteobacteria bacterium]|nr:class I SAM-dependent methyltransferase [Deltaproteobacteria bacterium]